MNNAAALQRCAAIEGQQFMIQGWSDSHTCSHRPGSVRCWSSQELSPSSWRAECGEGCYSADLSAALDAWVCPAGMLKALGVTLCCATCEVAASGKAFHSTQSKNTEWAELISPGRFLVLRTPEFYCSSSLRCEDKKGATVTVTELYFLEKFMEGKSQHHATLWVCKIWSDCPKGVVVAEQKIKTLR